MTFVLIGQFLAVLIVGIVYTLPSVVARESPRLLGLITLVLVGFGAAHAARLAAGSYPVALQPLAVALLFAYAGSAFAIGVRFFRKRREIAR